MKNAAKFEIGIIGLGAMGQNLLLNMGDHGIQAIGLDKDLAKILRLQNKPNISATQDMTAFLGQLREPRAVLLLVPAGPAVDSLLQEISPRLVPGDLIIDAGNSHYKDTNSREKDLLKKGIHFFGMGISGGEAGARNGPSLMPGGDKIAYERMRPILEAIAANVNGEPCVAYMGPGSAGHYVKMVHNGIEYALMELIAESYSLMRLALKLSNDECQETFQRWNQTELGSYLLEITAKIFLQKDGESQQPLIDKIQDVAKQTGTGMWTSQDALELQMPIPTIDAAVAMRNLSAMEGDRKTASRILMGPEEPLLSLKRDLVLSQLRNAYFAGSLIAFAQGMALLQKASEKYLYDLNLESVARIWRGGCIIRAELLETILSAFHRNSALSNLLLDPKIGSEVGKRQSDLRAVAGISSAFGITCPGFMTALAYYDGLRTIALPTNLIQAQRDYFGAHKYQRVDEPGIFHSKWEQ